jgi:outer membrane receptor protein involved in Fe transport
MTANGIQSFNFARVNDPISGLPGHQNRQFSANSYLKTGIEGELFGGDFTWGANYGYSRSVQRVYNLNNISAEKSAAALDAVINPANGRIVCQISLTPFASRFPDCEPLNPFGPTSISKSAWAFVTDDTRYTLANLMHDANLQVAGSPFSLWAGPVRFAVTGEYRWLSLRNISNAEPANKPDCTGLRIVGVNCLPTTPLYSSNSTASMYATQNVKEVSGEMLLPLLKDVPFFQSLELNVAGRYTDYSTSGSVETWKLGGTWQVNDELRFRASKSKDIRAPTLQDLFAPQSAGVGGFTDLHTNISNALVTYTQGNPTLVPEVAKTNTVGMVYQPNWLPRFSLTVDYYEIQMQNAITNQGPSANNQRECEDSGGVSPLCSTLERPLPFSNHTPANFPTRGLSTGVNAQKQWTRGFDMEVNYRFDVADVVSSIPGELRLRALVAYQPLLKTQTIVSLPPTEASGIAGFSKLRVNMNVNYTLGALSISVTDRFQTHQWQSDPRINTDLRPIIKSAHYFDATISYEMSVRGHQFTPFVTIENLLDRQPPITGITGPTSGLRYPTAAGFDIVGRYFTGGIRARF